ncbi:GGDEF domain-containing protein [Labedella populi]|uniref:GGDEF domain-containing protein n=1 Tax=Labedella populi TaxID=2498850 RepID=A0A3S4BDY0_9MICO|nr:GGDEF domain-containing protein [Labedella populi]RWZ68438.1 GGDEF domain-containing protein [Labedella populi]
MMLDTGTLMVMSALVTILAGASFILNTSIQRIDLVSRLWTVAFTNGMLASLAYGFDAISPGLWVTVAVGNAAVTAAVGFVWAGCRAYNGRRPWLVVVVVVTVAVAAAVVVRGPEGGEWAGGWAMLAGVGLFALLAGVEGLTGQMRSRVNARLLAVVMLVIAGFYLARCAVFLLYGPYSDLFRAYFGTNLATFVTILFMISSSVAMTSLQVERSLSGANPLVRGGRRTFTLGVLASDTFEEGARDRIDRARRRSSSVALLLIRIDGLKEINTAFGRGTGDVALQTVATVLREVTPTSSILGRQDSSHFGVLVMVSEPQATREIAEAVLAEIVEARVEGTNDIRLSASIGVADSFTVPFDFDKLRDAALGALDRAREAGGNRVEAAVQTQAVPRRIDRSRMALD